MDLPKVTPGDRWPRLRLVTAPTLQSSVPSQMSGRSGHRFFLREYERSIGARGTVLDKFFGMTVLGVTADMRAQRRKFQLIEQPFLLVETKRSGHSVNRGV